MTSPSLFVLEEGMIFNLFLSPMDRVMHPHPPCSAADSWTRDSGNIAIIELIVHKKYEGTHLLLDAHGKKQKKQRQNMMLIIQHWLLRYCSHRKGPSAASFSLSTHFLKFKLLCFGPLEGCNVAQLVRLKH